MRFIFAAASAALLLAVPAIAGVSGAHLVGGVNFTTADNTLTASGKVAGLGNVEQIHVTLTADAACINGGGNHPKAVNKGTFTASGDFPVQNGKAEFSLTLTATFSPDCSPPMTVQFSNITGTVTAPGVSLGF